MTALLIAAALTLIPAWNALVESRLNFASVLAADAARSGPGASFARLVEFEAGAAVWVDASRAEAGFVRVWLPDGRAGYLPATHVREVSPGAPPRAAAAEALTTE
jgi:hypothetical protein